MYGNYNSTYMLDRLNRQREEIDNLIRNYQNSGQQTPVNNFINTNQSQNTPRDLVEWRVLNENEDVDNLYVSNKTLFISDNMMILKGVDGSIQKWNITKFYPKDKKDEKIQELENKIKELEMKINEPTKSTSTIRERNKSYDDANEHIEPKPKANVEYASKQEW